MNPVENQEEINAAIDTRTALSLAITRLVKRGDIFHPSNSRFVIRSRT